ncbi:MAG: hypothetical protein ACOC80_10850 [Petrotogales bacterium]
METVVGILQMMRNQLDDLETQKKNLHTSVANLRTNVNLLDKVMGFSSSVDNRMSLSTGTKEDAPIVSHKNSHYSDPKKKFPKIFFIDFYRGKTETLYESVEGTDSHPSWCTKDAYEAIIKGAINCTITDDGFNNNTLTDAAREFFPRITIHSSCVAIHLWVSLNRNLITKDKRGFYRVNLDGFEDAALNVWQEVREMEEFRVEDPCEIPEEL